MIEKVAGIKLDILSIKHKLPIGIKYPNPEQIGADRIADAAGAVARYGHPVIVADFGTALTFDVVDEEYHDPGSCIQFFCPDCHAHCPLVQRAGEFAAE